MTNLLSKSSYMNGNQCGKMLYLKKFRKDLIPPITELQNHVFDSGIDLGLFAQNLFPEGEIGQISLKMLENVEKTKQLIESGVRVIYEACFMFNDCYCAIDILVKHNDKWSIYEVKNTNSVKSQHITDIGFQYYVAQKNIEIDDISIIHLDREYLRKKDLDVFQLFKIESVYSKAIESQQNIEIEIEALKKIINTKKEPIVGKGKQCNTPYQCDFIDHCWEKGTFNKKEKEVAIFDVENVKQFVSSLQYPLYFFDFETVAYNVPLHENSRPYQAIPFQYSLHVLEGPGCTLQHYEFLGDGKTDPRIELTKSLIKDLKTTGSILVWYQPFEDGKLKDLAIDFDEYSKEIHEIRARLVDLMLPFKKKYFRHPDFEQSSSIKKVLPVLVPELNYGNLNIQEGLTASYTYSILGKMEDSPKEKTILDLLEYCKLDTFAMVRILEEVEKKLSSEQ